MLIYVLVRLNKFTDEVASIRTESTASEEVYVGDADSDSDCSSSDDFSHNDMETYEETGKWHKNC